MNWNDWALKAFSNPTAEATRHVGLWDERTCEVAVTLRNFLQFPGVVFVFVPL